MGSVFTSAVGIVRWSLGFIKDIHFRGLCNDSLYHGTLLLPLLFISLQVCDETNQSRGFAMIAAMAGFGRLFVCEMIVAEYISLALL